MYKFTHSERVECLHSCVGPGVESRPAASRIRALAMATRRTQVHLRSERTEAFYVSRELAESVPSVRE